MHPRDFREAQSAIRIFEDYDMIVENTLGCWTVHYSDGSMHGQFCDIHSMYCAAVGFKEGFSRASIEESVSAYDLADEVGDIEEDTFTVRNISELAPIKQWLILSTLLEEHGYKIVRQK